MASQTVVILGGGIGGQVAANALRHLLPMEHRVVVIERDANHAFAPSFLWLMTGERSQGQIVRPLKSLLRRGVELVTSSSSADRCEPQLHGGTRSGWRWPSIAW